eukprot:SAG31_NODE_4066_length_3623_cov_2.164302_7_plen_241_part_00
MKTAIAMYAAVGGMGIGYFHSAFLPAARPPRGGAALRGRAEAPKADTRVWGLAAPLCPEHVLPKLAVPPLPRTAAAAAAAASRPKDSLVWGVVVLALLSLQPPPPPPPLPLPPPPPPAPTAACASSLLDVGLDRWVGPRHRRRRPHHWRSLRAAAHALRLGTACDFPRPRGSRTMPQLLRALGSLLLAGAAAAQNSNSAHLIVRKDIASETCDIGGSQHECVVAGKETLVHYTIFNVGSR